jgi:hypothetical protein
VIDGSSHPATLMRSAMFRSRPGACPGERAAARLPRSPPGSNELRNDEPRSQKCLHPRPRHRRHRSARAARALQRKAAKTHHFRAQLTINVTPYLRGRIKVAAFRRGITVAEMLRDLPSGEFPPHPGYRTRELTPVELFWIEKQVENRNPIRSKRRSTHHRPPVAHRFLLGGRHLRLGAVGRERVQNHPVAHQHPARDRARRPASSYRICT